MMKVKVKYFGMLLEDTLVNEEVITIDSTSLIDLKEQIENKYSGLKNRTYNIAVNQEIVKNEIELTEGNEIAFLPPFAGG